MALIDLLPSYYQNSKEAADLQNSLTAQIEAIQNTKEDLFQQLHVNTATWGLKYWETALGLDTDISKSYGFRRSRVESKLRSQGITTKAMIQNMAESFSNGSVSIVEHAPEYRFNVKFTGTLGVPPNMEDLTAAIEEIKPAHLAFVYVYTFVLNSHIKQFTHAQLAQFTHYQIRNGEGI